MAHFLASLTAGRGPSYRRAVLLLLFAGLLLAAAPPAPTPQLALHAVPVVVQGRPPFELRVPTGHHLSVAAEGLARPRFFARAPDGRLFVTDLHSRADNTQGRIMLLKDWDDTQHRFRQAVPYLEHLHNPNQIAFYTAPDGRTTLFIAETDQLRAFDYVPDGPAPVGPGRVLARFPAYGLGYKYGGWHLTRSLALHQGKLYVSIGSSCNACREKEVLRACVLEMNLDGSDARPYATGLRNAVGLRWVGNELWATNMGRDGIGPDEPQDVLTTVRRGGFYGWPFFHQYRQRIKPDPYFADSARAEGLHPEPPGLCGFRAHSAPLGLSYFEHYADPRLNQHMLVALHGSTTVGRLRGNEVVLVTGRDTYVPVLTGFLQGKTEASRLGRPCDVWQAGPRSFLVSDDKNGVIYCVWM